MKRVSAVAHIAPRAIALLSAVCALCVLLYGIFLLEAVAHTASRSQAQAEVRSLSLKLSQLEAQYLAQTQAITPEKAKVLGYVAPAVVSTVYAQAPGLSVRAGIFSGVR
ncbi:MAG: hypothetical protein KGI70_02860 [Patescibacteria group bacterium]|nr:hypothetical protein [Patescibacteria group bacterium]